MTQCQANEANTQLHKGLANIKNDKTNKPQTQLRSELLSVLVTETQRDTSEDKESTETYLLELTLSSQLKAL